VNLKTGNESAGFPGGIKDHMAKNMIPLIDNTIEHRSDGLSSNGDELKETNYALRTQGE